MPPCPGRPGHQRRVEDDIAGHVTDHGFEVFALHRSGEGGDMFQAHWMLFFGEFDGQKAAGGEYSAAVAIPSFEAIRRAVSSRFAVTLDNDWRARSRTAGGAFPACRC